MCVYQKEGLNELSSVFRLVLERPLNIAVMTCLLLRVFLPSISFIRKRSIQLFYVKCCRLYRVYFKIDAFVWGRLSSTERYRSTELTFPPFTRMYINAGLVKHQLLHLISLGVSAEFLEAESGIGLALLDQPDARIPVKQADALVAAGLKQLKNPDDFLKIAEDFNPEILGTYGNIVKSSRTIGEYCQLDSKFSALIKSESMFAFDTDANFLVFSCNSTYYSFSRHIEASILIMELEMLKTLTKKNFHPVRVFFVHPKPENTDEVDRMFRCPIEYNQPFTRMIFDKKVLDYDIKTYNKHALKVFKEYAESLLDKFEDQQSFKSKISSMIARYLPEGDANITHISDLLNMSRQAVYKRLKKEDSSFSVLLQEVRKDLMMKYMKQQQLTFKEVSELLGYSDVSVFHKTFKSRFNQTAVQYRENINS